MTESEKRRVRLLRETRMLYRDQSLVPAVHPRFQTAYRELYQQDCDEKRKGTLWIRLCIALLLFSAFVAYQKEGTLQQTNCSKIVSVISEDVLQEWKGVWP